MVNKSGKIGTEAETAIVRVLRLNGFGLAERKVKGGGGQHEDFGDITGTPGLTWQVKGGEYARKMTPQHEHEWLDSCELQRSLGRNDFGILIVQRKGYSYPRAHHWWAILREPADLAAIVNLGAQGIASATPTGRRLGSPTPVRMMFADLLPLFRLAGYGDPLH